MKKAERTFCLYKNFEKEDRLPRKIFRSMKTENFVKLSWVVSSGIENFFLNLWNNQFLERG